MLRTIAAMVAVAIGALAPAAAGAQAGGTAQTGTAVQSGAGGSSAGEPGAQPGAAAQPGSTQQGGASQQVVVNPPQPNAPAPPPPQAPPSSTTVVNPPPPARAPSTTVVNPPREDSGSVLVERPAPRRSAMATVAIDAGWGALAGFVVGTGVALINQWDKNWDRDMMVGAGIGILAGAGVGVVQAYLDSQPQQDRLALDGLNTTDRYPVRSAPVVLGWGGRF
jgi:hypothetical protein